MSQHRPRIVGLALLAALVLAPTALAAAPAQAEPGAAKAKQRAYAKQCGASRTGSVRSRERAECLAAMSKLATGKSSSPRHACRALSRKKSRGARMSAYARCVKAGAKLVKTKRRGANGGGARAADPGDEDVDPEGDGSADEDSGAGAAGAAGAGGDQDEPEDGSDPDDATNDDAPEE